MATAQRSFSSEIAHGFSKERASCEVVDLANGFSTTKGRAGNVDVDKNGFTTTKVRTRDPVEVPKERASNVEIAENGFATKQRANNVDIAENGFTTKQRASNVDIAENGFTTKQRAGDVEITKNDFSIKERAVDVDVARNDFTTKEIAGGDVEIANGFITNERVGDVKVANDVFTSKEKSDVTNSLRAGDVEIAKNGFTTKEGADDVEDAKVFSTQEKPADVTNSFAKERTGDDVEVLHDFSPLLVVYKSGRLERPLILPLVPPGHDDDTGVVSKDVPFAASFVRLYLPPGTASGRTGGGGEKTAKLPVVVYFHGGGFVIGSAASCVYHRFLNDLAAACPAVAVSVDYRLAPKHLLPAAYEDSLAALKWVLSAADPWLAAHGDLDRVFLAGDSAGGNICHHLAMHPDTRDAGLKGIVLIHPWFWGKQPIAGELEHRRSPLCGSGPRKKSLWEYVCPDAADGVDDPRMNPIAPGAPGLDNLACEKVMVCVAEGDHLQWRGKAYAEAAARTTTKEVETVESEGVGHVFYLLDPDMEEAREMLGRIAGFVNGKQQGASERAAAATASSAIE